MKIWSKYIYNEWVIAIPTIVIAAAINENTNSNFWSLMSYWIGLTALLSLVGLSFIRIFIAWRNLLTTEIYKIKKGNHFSGFRFYPMFFPREVRFTFSFSDASKYLSSPGTQLREQWNKLGGVSFGLFGRKSARIAWRYNSDKNVFEICNYFHKGKRHIVPEYSIVEIPQDEIFGVRIFREKEIVKTQLIHPGGYVNEKKYLLDGVKFSLLGYKQFPYFGGKAPAPNEISIRANFNIKSF